MATISSLDVMKYISGVTYPARKSEIISYADMQGAGNDPTAMSLLNGLSRSSYDTSIQIERELDTKIRSM